ncbi:NnrU [Candidatus Terasakiella magnetica]|uniref:NnrU n=1 Tax=Candidatus Terasakiella magnetica TaxID=1867952 RepID=A0A1C3RKR3_9PROT|nr:NnrU family protein [Candidatus Terasakiella magnetica]SCA57912.1 NnrU [Candidatus Terasakiella magnetica]
METIILGLWLWISAHMIPVVAPDMRARLVARLGEMPYKGLFALVVLASVGLMVLGWRSINTVTPLYDIYNIVAFPALAMILAGFVLMAAAKVKCNFQRVIRHPQLTGFSLWAIAHMLMNGDLHAVVLFGGLAAWSISTIFLLNKRDGAFIPPAKQLPHKGVIAAAIGFVIFIALVMGHEYFSGIDLTVKRH